MKRLAVIAFVLCTLMGAQRAAAQYYTWGSDPPNLKWSTIRTPDVRMIYPDTAADAARRTLYYVRTVQPYIGYGFRHGPMRIPFVMHPENFRSNGLVMYLPKRVELLTAPAIESYAMPWYKQLSAHEYRHAVQYNNLDRGVIRVLSRILGQQGSTIGLLCMPIWAMEGDAVMAETQMATFGRGLQPSFSMGFRALGNIGRERRNLDRWFCGSYRDYTPDHYELGYQICSYAYEKYGENIWDKVAWYGSRNPYVLATTRVALGKFYGTNVGRLFRETFDDLTAYWSSLPDEQDSARPLVALPDDDYTTYRWPLALAGGEVLSLKSDLKRSARFVAVDPATGRERLLARVGSVSTRPAIESGGRRVWWTEYRRSKLFEQRVNSQLCYMDLSDCRPRTVARERRVLYPTPAGDALAWVEYDYSGTYSVVVRRDGACERFEAPRSTELHGLAWDGLTQAFYVLATGEEGMRIARIGADGLHDVTGSAFVTLSDLRAADGRLYYGSIASGKDEAWCYDLASRCACRLTVSRYGSFDPAPSESGVLVTTYDRRGYRVAVQPFDQAKLVCQAPVRVPDGRINPPRRRWPVVNLDTVRFTAEDSVRQESVFRTRRYRKAPNLLNVHSWMPAAFDPFSAVDEHVIDLNVGVTLLSQNLLSNTEAFASYGWNRSEGSVVRLGARYFGLGVHFDLEAAYGGNQVFYSLGQYNEITGRYEYLKLPSADRYYSVGLGATLPLRFECGYHTRQLSVSAGWNYSNGMVANPGRIEWKDHNLTNMEHIGFHEGLHKLAFGAGFSDQVRMAHRDLAPRWGYTLSASYMFNPADRYFSDLMSFYARGYLPGVRPHHSLSVAANYQTSIGGYKFPSGYAPLSYRSARLIPRGYSSSDILANDYTAVAVNYQLPVWYPEGGINSVLYFKRVRVNVGGDFAQFRDVAFRGLAWRRIWSVGADLVLDVNIFRQPASATSSVKLSVYHPSSGGVWFGASVGLPF